MSRPTVSCPRPDPVALALQAEGSAENAAQAWLRNQEAVAEGLEIELETAKQAQAEAGARVRRIEDMLARVRGAALPEAPASTLVDVFDADIDLSTATIAEAIWFAVAANRKGATAAEIQAWVLERGREITTKFLHTYVHRMLGDGRLRAEGAKGSRKYFIGKPKDHKLMGPHAQRVTVSS